MDKTTKIKKGSNLPAKLFITKPVWTGCTVLDAGFLVAKAPHLLAYIDNDHGDYEQEHGEGGDNENDDGDPNDRRIKRRNHKSHLLVRWVISSSLGAAASQAQEDHDDGHENEEKSGSHHV